MVKFLARYAGKLTDKKGVFLFGGEFLTFNGKQYSQLAFKDEAGVDYNGREVTVHHAAVDSLHISTPVVVKGENFTVEASFTRVSNDPKFAKLGGQWVASFSLTDSLGVVRTYEGPVAGLITVTP